MAGDHVGSPLQRKNIKRSDSAGALSLQKKVKQMKFITVKELATQMKKNREIISKEKVIITWKGKPIAIIRPLCEDNFENAVNDPVAEYGSKITKKDRMKFKKAVENLQNEAQKRGITQKDIDEAVLAVRAEMRAERNAKNRN